MKLLYLLALTGVIFTSCGTNMSDSETTTENPVPDTPAINLAEGTWLGKLVLGDGDYIPFNFSVAGEDLTVQNSSEKITTSITIVDDSLHVKMPAFDSEFRFVSVEGNRVEGYWINNAKKDYRIPFVGYTTDTPEQRFDHAVNNSTNNFQGKWETTFDMKYDPYKAIGIFEQYKESVNGTFLTETGDYRFLQGNVINDSLFLSCFDGAHAFLFTAVLEGDSLRGQFRSGKHYTDSLWVAKLNEEFELTDPDSLTYIVEDAGPFEFSFPSINEGDIAFPSDKYNGKVTIVQIFGSWCPNCKDEAEFYADLYNQFNSEGLEIIGLGFEVPESLEDKKARVKDFASSLDIPYDFAIGGSAKKDLANKALPQLNHIMSFPTSVIIDRQGKIRKIHTGFYGPGTGKYYSNYTERMTHFIKELLMEEAI